ncbi:MAG: PEP-CTERM sorting domain-containing protein [Methylococcaceae bacterium]|nr:PEP-CTERM sorting domain-containing protein [Methylococcaceae bacterium]
MKKIILASGLLALAATGNAFALNIDSFTDFQTTGGNGATTVYQDLDFSLTPAGSDFDERDFTVSVGLNPSSQNTALTSSVGAISFSKGPNSYASWDVLWTLLSGNELDFTENGTQNQIKYQVKENNAPFADIIFDILDSDGTHANYSVDNVPFILSGSPQDYMFNFSSFVIDMAGATAGLDFTKITELSLHVDGTDAGNGADLQFAFIKTDYIPPPQSAPEPVSLGMIGLGLAGMATLRRRKKS